MDRLFAAAPAASSGVAAAGRPNGSRCCTRCLSCHELLRWGDQHSQLSPRTAVAAVTGRARIFAIVGAGCRRMLMAVLWAHGGVAALLLALVVDGWLLALAAGVPLAAR